MSKLKRMSEVVFLFEKVVRNGVILDFVMFNVMINGYCANGNVERVFLILREIERRKFCFDEVIYNILM